MFCNLEGKRKNLETPLFFAITLSPQTKQTFLFVFFFLFCFLIREGSDDDYVKAILRRQAAAAAAAAVVFAPPHLPN